MASVIALHRTAAPAGARAAPHPTLREFVGHLRNAIAAATRRDLVRRELLHLGGRHLRDIGLERRDLLGPADIHLAVLVEASRTGINLLYVPRP